MLKNFIKLKNFQIPIQKNISTTSKLCLDNIFNITNEKEFDRKVLEAEVPVLVGFFSTDCHKSKMLIPKTAMIANEFKDKISLAEVNFLKKILKA